MNCETLPLMLNAALDGELSPQERAAMQQHLAECESCREQWAELQSLHQDLSLVLSPPSVEPAIRRLMGTLQPTSNRTHDRSRVSTGNSGLVVAAIACTLLLTVGIVFQSPSPALAVAEISMMTGTIDYKSADARDWTSVAGTQRISLPAFARVRTRSTSLCEIRTGCDALVRLNHETELVLHRAEKVELVAGELWCRAPATTEMEICAPSVPRQPALTNVFTCPSSAEMQWKALPNNVLSCQDVANTAVELQSPSMNCTIQPGECITFSAGQPIPEPTQFNPVIATGWQLPLLVLRPPQDSELRDRLTSVLALIGRSKASFLYENQIRGLGPSGVVPLLAYVRSKESVSQPDLRLRAMEMIAEMATAASIDDLKALLLDSDPRIRKLSGQALTRLQPGRTFSDGTTL
ncbi:MAG: hypothetical protein JWP89_7062 [Schlesneria sp.]|nr:hypothetical protein [Schlesneria sp.]